MICPKDDLSQSTRFYTPESLAALRDIHMGHMIWQIEPWP